MTLATPLATPLAWIHNPAKMTYRSEAVPDHPKGKYLIAQKVGGFWELMVLYEKPMTLLIGTLEDCKALAESCEVDKVTDADEVPETADAASRLVKSTSRGAASASRLAEMTQKGAPAEMIDFEVSVLQAHLDTAIENLRSFR